MQTATNERLHETVPSDPREIAAQALKEKQAQEAKQAQAQTEDAEENKRKAEELKAELASKQFVRVIAGRPIVFRRWGWGTAQSILPQLLNIVGAIFRIAQTQTQNAKLSREQLQKIVTDGTLALQLTPMMMKDLMNIQAQTLAADSRNGMSIVDADKWLQGLEVEEGMEVLGWIYKQNVEMIAKNVLGLIGK